ncbi:rhomboid protease [Malassezia cuniculi]|uniref:Rhomboid protease n=1 Tax=Malassezia cuniculi TaxID=948313 RepID=A0AAF0ES40_9BASI|nr:rhomboid protease [Malassezia cuniculi]
MSVRRASRVALKAPTPRPKPAGARLTPPNIGRAVAFFGGVSLVAYYVAATASTGQTRRLQAGTLDSPFNLGTFFAPRSTADERLAVAKTQDDAYKLGTFMQRLKRGMDAIGIPLDAQDSILRGYLWLSEGWLELPPSKKAVVPIIAVNACVFAAWHVPRLTPVVSRWFIHRACSPRVATMLTSVYSHRSLGHFALNNIALWSIGSAALTATTVSVWPHIPEASETPHFLAFFATAGTFAALTSHIVSAARFRALARHFGARWRTMARSKQAAILNIVGRGSLGSSGAVYAALVLTALAFPDASVSLVFLPMTAMPIQWGVAGMVAMDVVGLVRGWRTFDHAAHLGGAFFGILYYVWGPRVWEEAKPH